MSGAGLGRYYYRSEGKESGPVTAEKLLELFETHMLTAYDEVRGERETEWLPIQQAVTGILEARKAGGGRAKPAARHANPALAGATGSSDEMELELSVPAARLQPNQLVEQRGAKAPKGAGEISDEDLASSIDYAHRAMRRGWIIRGSITFVLLAIAGVVGLRFSANLRANTPQVDVPWRIETSLSISEGKASMAGRGSGTGTGTLELVRVRNVTFKADGSVDMQVEEDVSRVRADLEGATDYNERKPGSLHGRALTFTVSEGGWLPQLQGATMPAQSAAAEMARIDNTALYPSRRLWPWPWQSWLVTAPEACSVLALDVQSCKSEVRMRFLGFASCGTERCARLSFVGDWIGDADGDRINLKLSGEILRSVDAGIDVSIQGEGDLSITRTIAGPTSTNQLTLAGPVVYAQTTSPAP